MKLLQLTLSLAITALLVACSVEVDQQDGTPAPVVEQPEPEPQPEEPQPQPEPQPEPEPEVSQQEVEPPEVQSQTSPDVAPFLGESFAQTDRFDGSTTVVIAAYGDGAFPYDGILGFWCSDGDTVMILADIPYVASDTRRGTMFWVTPSTYGDAHSVTGAFFDSDGGDRNWRARNLRPEWFSTPVDELPDNPNATAFMISHLVQDGEISIRIQTYGEVFGATFQFGDVTQSEHWMQFVECVRLQ